MDAIARELGLDPVAGAAAATWSRPTDLPYTMATGEVLSDVTPRETLEAALAAIDYDGVPRPPARGARAGPPTWAWASARWSSRPPTARRSTSRPAFPGSGHEAAWVRIEPSGVVNASVGPGRDRAGLRDRAGASRGRRPRRRPGAASRIQLGHTDIAPYGMGSRGARGGTAGGGTLYLCALEARAKVLAIAAQAAGPARAPRPAHGRRPGRAARGRRDGCDTGLTLADVARTAYLDPLALPRGHGAGAGIPPHLRPAADDLFQRHARLRGRGRPGHRRRTHPALPGRPRTAAPCSARWWSKGQQHGAIAMGLSGALFEQVDYDEQRTEPVGLARRTTWWPRPTNCRDFEIICHAHAQPRTRRPASRAWPRAA